MTENLFEANYDLTKKSKFRKFYDGNKIYIISSIITLVILFISFNFYLEYKKSKKILLSENYIKAKIYLEANDKQQATDILKNIIEANESTYSTLSLFLIINQNLVKDKKEISIIFDKLIKNNNFPDEIRNLLIYKKALFQSSFVEESKFLESTKLLINSESKWKPHALLLLGDYFVSKKEYIKAIEFYQEIFTIKNLDQNIYNHARSQLTIISDE